MGPTLSFRGIDNAVVLSAVARGSALLHGLHRLRQHVQHAQPARAAADHGQPALLDHGDARRRFPLRSGQHAGPRAARGRQAGRVLRHHPPGPGHLAGQADRRAVGPGRRRLPGRQLSRSCGRSGTASIATASATSGKATAAWSSEFATRFCGSSDLYEWSSRRPHASINFVTCHDGFTLHDLVCYDHKHNEANGEDNRDGANDNISWNCGVEGPTDDPKILALRERRSAASWPRCCFRKACRCCWPATKSATRSTATTTPIARTTRSPGSTGT